MSSSYYHVIIYYSNAPLIYDYNFFHIGFEVISYDYNQLCSCLGHLVIDLLLQRTRFLLMKSHQPNWEHDKILALIKAKKEEHMASLDTIDARNKFETNVTKWNQFQQRLSMQGFPFK